MSSHSAAAAGALTPQQIAILNFYKAYHNPNITGTFEPEIVDITAWTPYPFQFVTYLLGLYAAGSMVEAALSRLSEKYRGLPLSKQRIVVTYFMELVVTTVVFLLQMVYGYSIFRNEEHIPFANVQMARVCGYLLCGLYLWELMYRFEMGKPLMAHHLMTIILLQVFFPFIQEYPLLIVVRCALVVLLSATTEQVSFIALLMFRFGFLANASATLLAAGITSFIVKTIVCLVTFSVWGEFITTPAYYEPCPEHWRNFLTYFFPFLYLFLYATQLIAVKIFFALALRTTNDYLKHNKATGVHLLLKRVQSKLSKRSANTKSLARHRDIDKPIPSILSMLRRSEGAVRSSSDTRTPSIDLSRSPSSQTSIAVTSMHGGLSGPLHLDLSSSLCLSPPPHSCSVDMDHSPHQGTAREALPIDGGMDPALHPSMEAGAPAHGNAPGPVPYLEQMTVRAFWAFTDDAESRAQWRPRVCAHRSQGTHHSNHHSAASDVATADHSAAETDAVVISVSGPASDSNQRELPSADALRLNSDNNAAEQDTYRTSVE